MDVWDDSDVLEAERQLLERIRRNPSDVGCLIKLCMTELAPPLYDYISALGYLERIYDIDSCNHTAIILEAGIKHHNMVIDEVAMNRLRSIKGEGDEEKAIILYLMSLYYKTKNHIAGARAKRRFLLESAIALYEEFPYPNYDMGQILLGESQYAEALLHFEKAVDCVTHVFDPKKSYDFTDPRKYIEEFITGRYLSRSNYEHMMWDCEAVKQYTESDAPKMSGCQVSWGRIVPVSCQENDSHENEL